MRFVAFAALALCVGGAQLAASAQNAAPSPAPTPVNLPTLPPQTTLDPFAKAAIDILGGVVRGQLQRNANSTYGRVTYFKRFELQVQTGPNAYRSVHLHQGTVINPRGATLTPGQVVSAGGIAQADGSLNADTITIQQ